MKNNEEQLSKYYKHFGINVENLTRLGEMNVMIQAFANDINIDDDNDNVHIATSYMPRKGYRTLQDMANTPRKTSKRN